MAVRGEQLRNRILWAAKDVFLQHGFERTSMDMVAAKAETSKRTLYAHHKSKESLFLAVIELVRGLVLDRLGHPGDYSEDPTEALIRFCEVYGTILRYEASIQMCRLVISEANRFPEGASQHYDVVFGAVERRISHYLAETLGPEGDDGAAVRSFMAQLLHPHLGMALFGLVPLSPSIDAEKAIDSEEMRRVRSLVGELLATRS